MHISNEIKKIEDYICENFEEWDLDDPDKEGKVGQIICYIHDPDEVIYVAESLTELIKGIMDEIE